MGPEFDSDFDEEDLDRDALVWMESMFFDLLLWENFEPHDSNFVFPPFALLFRLHALFDSEHQVLHRGPVFLLSDSN